MDVQAFYDGEGRRYLLAMEDLFEILAEVSDLAESEVTEMVQIADQKRADRAKAAPKG
jgi:hypothetical protein